MRPVLIILLLSFVGCLASETPYNPMKKAVVADIAPVATHDGAEIDLDELDDKLDAIVKMGDVELMMEMFLIQLAIEKDVKELIEAKDNLNTEILKTAGKLSQEQMDEFNEWLAQYGIQIKRRRKSRSKAF